MNIWWFSFFAYSPVISSNLYSGDGGGFGDEDMVMEDMNAESLAAMKCPITTKPLQQAARANVSIYAFVSNNNTKY